MTFHASNRARRVDLSPWVRQRLGPATVQRLHDAVPMGVRVSMSIGRGLTVGILDIPGQDPVRLYGEAPTVAQLILDRIAVALPAHTS